MDVHKDSISIGILRPDEVSPDAEKIFHDEASVRRFMARFPEPAQLSACYEAGPTGYELHRLLTSMGVSCQVIAPSRHAPITAISDQIVALDLGRVLTRGEPHAVMSDARVVEAYLE